MRYNQELIGQTVIHMQHVRASAFNAALCARVRSLRETRGWTQEEMAAHLGVPAARYRKYESVTPLPHYLLERFASLVGRDVVYVLTGRNPKRTRGVAGRARDTLACAVLTLAPFVEQIVELI